MYIKLYGADLEHCPVADFLKELKEKDFKAFRVVNSRIRKLEQYGSVLITNPDFVKKLQPDLYELRILHRRLAYRILFTIVDASCYLLHAFVKKSDNTPNRYIATAIARIREL